MNVRELKGLLENFPDDFVIVSPDREFDVIWCEAYDSGHSAGLEEVENYFRQYVDLCRKFVEAGKQDG